jgi:mRNA interferase YafQ
VFKLNPTGSFKKDYKVCIKRNYDLSLIQKVFEILNEKGELPVKYKPHTLSGNYAGCWECHIKPDWLLIWYYEDPKTINLVRTGTHSDLF